MSTNRNKTERTKAMRKLTPPENKVATHHQPILRHPPKNRGRFAKPKPAI